MSDLERCEGCGFGWDDLAAEDLPDRLLAVGPRYRSLLLPPDRPPGWVERLRRRPAEGIWSPLEYACHVRDVLLVQRDRLYHALVEHQPTFAPMHREERVVLGAYAEEDPGEVVAQLEVAATMAARAVALVEPDLLERTCVYAFPSPKVRSLRWLGAQTVHEAEHHADDIVGGLG